ncbi:hypothetical protein Ga0466249_003406 [Sporomusaceae bacterium BoRhaA]|uniref:hypothetical protein n=1 Tax=Pelorhabdus rhamnosifermentans TaxID=2772457 RepID=UPI001C063F31|nr:hypothetical protein [Pelorhabdus rhamnosifermentans]MBU2702279.1 hypothetical protein [Pelorhabdus rhamnosifermentans]
MANLIGHDDVYREPTLNKEDNIKTTFGEKIIIVAVYLLLMVSLGALSWYGASMGYYPDLSLIQ